MAQYRKNLPQLGRDLFLADSGLETDLAFNKGFDLPHFSTIPLLKDEAARQAIGRFYKEHIDIARRHGRGLILETPTWRASPDWAAPLGYSLDQLAAANRAGVELLAAVVAEASLTQPLVISGDVGPRGDGYDPGALMTAEEAETYHAWQVGVLAQTPVDFLTAMTITNSPEAIGFANAAAKENLSAVISFTVETDGRLPTGQKLGEAIMETDFETRKAPAYYLINCAHPTHFEDVLREGGPWITRLRGIRANASKCSHAELDEAETLDDGNPAELGEEYAALRRLLPTLTIFGGCCGTDARHIDKIAAALGNTRECLNVA